MKILSLRYPGHSREEGWERNTHQRLKFPQRFRRTRRKRVSEVKEVTQEESGFFSRIQGLVLVCSEELRIWDQETQRST